MSTRCVSGRRRRTRQMALSVPSMVKISASAVTSSMLKPATPRRLALAENCVT
jgi:hypothetical protein